MTVALLPRRWVPFALGLSLLALAAPPAGAEGGPGVDHWFGFTPNDPGNLLTIEVHLLAEQPVEVTVEYPIRAPSLSETVLVEPGAVTTVTLPQAAASAWLSDAVQDNAARAFGATPFTVLLAHRAEHSSDATAALPRMALGLDHFVAGQEPMPFTPSQFLVVATEDATRVSITPTAALGPHAAGVAYEVLLDAGEGYFAQAGHDAGDDTTGTRVKSDKPVAVFGGHACARAPQEVAACDHLFEQAEPVSAWGTSHVLAVVPDRPAGSIFRVLGARDATTLTLDGLLVGEIGAGEWLELTGVAEHALLESTEPVGVVQYVPGFLSPGATNGDPAIANVLPESRWSTSHAFTTLDPAQFDEAFLLLTVADEDAGLAALDGVPIDAADFTPVPGSGRSVAVVPLGPGVHVTTSGQPHGAVVGGYAMTDSYLYAAAPGAACALPVLESASASEPSDCRLGILVEWPPAAFPSGDGAYNLYRAVGPAATCADALAAGPVAVGLTDTRWIDRDTVPDEAHVYVVEAEDSAAAACRPAGPSFGGAVSRLCLPAVVDRVEGPLPEGVGPVLRGAHEAQEVTMSWAAARPLAAGELFQLTKSLDRADGAFEPIAEGPDSLRAHVETDERSPLQFFLVRVGDRCGNLSEDEFP